MRCFFNFFNYFWLHYVKQLHRPLRMFNQNEGICVCGKLLVKNKITGKWREL
jgi:hypothetical protein